MIAPSAGAIVNGSPDGNRHPYVVFVGQNLPPRTACSGTLIAPRVVVTAAHCARTPGEAMTVITGEQALPPTNPATRYAGVYTPDPTFCGGFCPGGLFDFVSNDLAVVLLNRDAPGPYGKLPRLNRVAKLFHEGGDDEGDNNNNDTNNGLRIVDIVGYGLTGPPPPAVGLGTRRSAQAEARISPSPDFIELPVPSSSRFGTGCFGDSGGPNLKGRTILGVISIADDACGGPAYAYRLDTQHALTFLSKYVDLKRSGDENDGDNNNNGGRG